MDLWLGMVPERTALELTSLDCIFWAHISLASKYSLPSVANYGASFDHMMPCGVQIKHASTCTLYGG